jgi:hypothetical protein
MSKKFEVYQCSICKRKINKEFSPQNPVINKCDITFRCLGTLSKIAETSVPTLGASFKAGVENWRPRGTSSETFTSFELKPEEYVIMSATIDGKIVVGVEQHMALKTFGLYFDKLRLNVTQVIKNKSLLYKDYQFKISRSTSGNLVLSGLDTNRKELKYDANIDTVLVYLNGVQLDGNSQYTVGINKVTLLGVMTPEYSTIDVIVKKQSPTEIVKSLNFTSNQALRNLQPGSWSNVTTVTIPINVPTGETVNKDYVLYTLDDSNELGFNTTIQSHFTFNDQSIQLYDSLAPNTILYYSLSNNPDGVVGLFSEDNNQFSARDRVLSAYVKLSDLRGTIRFMKYLMNSNIRATGARQYSWFVTKSAISHSLFRITTESYAVLGGVIQTDPIVIDNSSSVTYNSQLASSTTNFSSELIINP